MSRVTLVRIETLWQIHSLNNYFQNFFLVLFVYLSLLYFHNMIQQITICPDPAKVIHKFYHP